MERGCGGSVAGDVFGDRAEACAGVGSAGDEVGFSGILMLEIAGVADDPLQVSVGGAGERAVPLEGRKIVGGAGLVGELEQSLFG
jgi:hypothetical protein